VTNRRSFSDHLSTNITVLLILIGSMAGLYVIDNVLPVSLAYWGIIPRDTGSLMHIFTAPFIHGSLGHLVNNLVGLTVFSAICMVRSLRFWLAASVFVITVGGLLVWLFGRSALHIGASGWIFGLWSILIAMAFFDRRLINILIALVVVIFYGGMAYGVLPTDPRISFESHLFGALAGALFAYLYSRANKSARPT
jgi:membrane associated rhomboid family serine protease